MKTTPTIEQTFDQTTLNQDQIQAYLLGFPRYCHVGYQVAASDHAMNLLNYTDFFELQVRRYLAGLYPNLRRVFREVRMFYQFDPKSAGSMIAYSLGAVKQTILSNEWYELMPRYEQACRRIHRRFNLPALDLNSFI